MNRTLHFYSNGRKTIEIFDTDKKTLLYRVDMQLSKPNITVSRALHKDTKNTSDVVPIGTVTNHRWSSNMDVEIYGCPPITMKSGFMSSRYPINLPQLSGEWSSKGAMSNDLVFQTSAGARVALFEHSGWARHKKGKLHLTGATTSQAELDALVVTSLARIDQQRRASNSAAAGAAAGGAAGGGC